MPQQQNGDSKQGEDNSGGTEGWSYVLNGRKLSQAVYTSSTKTLFRY